MELNKAIAAVDERKSGKRVHFDWNDWSNAEETLRKAGDESRADFAHSEAIRAYRKEEWDADLG